jgi:hypothetical protein
MHLRIVRSFFFFLAGSLAVEPSFGNILQNGSFEVGLGGWSVNTRGNNGYPSDIRTMVRDPHPERIKVSDAPDGQYVLSFNSPAESGFDLFTRVYEVKPGKYQFRGYFKTPRPCTIQIINTKQTQDIPASSEWKKAEFIVSVDKNTALAVQISGSGPQLFQMDHIQLIPLADPAPSYPTEVGLETNVPDKVWFAADKKELIFRAFSKQNISGKIFYRIENAWGKDVTSGQVETDILQNRPAEKKIDLDLKDTGYYHILAQFQKEDKVLSDKVELLFGIVPDRILPTSLKTGEASRFGCNMRTRPYLIKLAQKVGIRWVFCAPPLFTKWHTTEPKKGMWLFYDDVVNLLADHGIHVCGDLADAPSWATDPKDKDKYGGPWPNPDFPLNWADWDTYVKNVVSHYYPRIKSWALWNEPDHTGFLQPEPGSDWVQKYQIIAKRTYPLVKSVNPNIQFFGGTTTHFGALIPLIQAGGLTYADGLSFHWASWTPQGYTRLTGEESGYFNLETNQKRSALNEEDGLRAQLLGPMKKAGKVVPYWNTECHLTQADAEREYLTQPQPPLTYEKMPRMTRLDAANAVVRQFIAEWAGGVGKTFAWMMEKDPPWDARRDATLIEWDESPTAPLMAFAVMTEKLEGAKFLKFEIKTDNRWLDKPTFWIFHFKTANGKMRVVWSNTDAPHQLLLPANTPKTTVWDMFGVESPGAKVNSGIDLKDNLNLSVARSPFYILEK